MSRRSRVRRRSDPELVSLLSVVTRQLQRAGVTCGPLVPLAGGAKRTVLTDGESVVTRTMRVDDPTLAPMDAEIAWALRAARTTRVQVPLVAHPLVSGGLATSVWQFLPADRAVNLGDIRELGALLARLHKQAPEGPVPPVSQLTTAEQRLRLLGQTRPETASRLRPLLDTAHAVLARQPVEPVVAVHGDAHDRNVLHTATGLVLIDFDSAGWGPPSLDLASVAYACRYRFGNLDAVDDLLDGYGPNAHVDRATLMDLSWVRRVRAACTRAHQGEDVDELLVSLRRDMPSD